MSTKNPALKEACNPMDTRHSNVSRIFDEDNTILLCLYFFFERPLDPFQPSAITVALRPTTSQMKGCIFSAEASGISRIRTHPKPFDYLTSTAITMIDLLLPRPRFPPSLTPPMKVSSTSTPPTKQLRSLRTIETR